MINEIMLKGGDNDMARELNKTSVSNIQGEIQSFQAMIAE